MGCGTSAETVEQPAGEDKHVLNDKPAAKPVAKPPPGGGPDVQAVAEEGVYTFEQEQAATIPASLQRLQLAQVRDLSIINCGLKELPAEIITCTCLLKLNLSENLLTVLPDSLPTLPKLEVFDCSDNQLVAMPDAPWASLKSLLLYKNQLSKLPESLGDSPAIEELNVYNNKLIRLPASLSKLSLLVELNVASNKLKTIPKTDSWANLTLLNIYWNNIVMLPDFNKLEALETLQMQEMQISSLPKLGAELVSLTELDANKNRIEELRAEDFVGLNNLTVLKITNNSFKSIPEEILALPKLKQLEISGNPVTVLPASFATSKLSVFFASDTHLSTLPACLVEMVSATGMQRCNLTNSVHLDQQSTQMCQELVKRVASSPESNKSFFFNFSAK